MTPFYDTGRAGTRCLGTGNVGGSARKSGWWPPMLAASRSPYVREVSAGASAQPLFPSPEGSHGHQRFDARVGRVLPAARRDGASRLRRPDRQPVDGPADRLLPLPAHQQLPDRRRHPAADRGAQRGQVEHEEGPRDRGRAAPVAATRPRLGSVARDPGREREAPRPQALLQGPADRRHRGPAGRNRTAVADPVTAAGLTRTAGRPPPTRPPSTGPRGSRPRSGPVPPAWPAPPTRGGPRSWPR